MPFTKGQPHDQCERRDMAYGGGKIVSRRAYGEDGPGPDLGFDSIESVAVDMGQAVLPGAIEEVLRIQFPRLGDHRPCPACGRACPGNKAPRARQIRGGTVQDDEPVGHGPACRRDFFPPPPAFAARPARLLARGPW